MSNKITKTKLSLDRESVLTLSPNALEAINGGVAWTGCDSACGACGTNGTRTGGPITNPRPNPPIGGSLIGCNQPATNQFK